MPSSDLEGELLLRKGAHALGIRYQVSSTDAAGAIRLAGPALQRLAAAPEPERPRVTADGCLPEATVGALVESPARLVVNAMSASGMCNYTLRSDPTVSIELAVQPAQRADDIFAELQQRVRLARGEIGGGGADQHRRGRMGLRRRLPVGGERPAAVGRFTARG